MKNIINVSRKQKTIFGIILGFIFLLSLGLTYAYFTTGLAEQNPNNQIVTTGSLNLLYVDGPAIIIAYSPCIEQGIVGGLSNSLEEQKRLVEAGYNILMRYNPDEDKLTIDSKEPDFSLYEDVFSKEMRYRNLEFKNKEEYEELYNDNMNYSKERFVYFKCKENDNK